MSHGNEPWPQERVERLVVLWREGLSGSQIAAELGDGIKRGTVLAKLARIRSRYGLESRDKDGKRMRAGMKLRTNDRPRSAGVAPRKQVASSFDAPALPPQSRPDGSPVTISNAVANECRWPYGDVGTVGLCLCGRQTNGNSYCDYHSRKAVIAMRTPKLQRGRS